jgi:2'-5' RNA ligase
LVKPLIVTLQLGANASEYFDRLREAYFPLAINHLKAHLTLFHNLPGEEANAVIASLAAAAAKRAAFSVEVSGLMRLGRGTAFRIESAALDGLRGALAQTFAPWLTKQDREAFRPHVTIQNKVAPHEATALFDHLSHSVAPFVATAEGLQLWRYEGGPWSPVAAIAFQGGA